jgi:peptide/nickel transport system permease protein
MAIDENTPRTGATGFEAIDTSVTGTVPQLPPTPGMIKDLGPFSDRPTAPGASAETVTEGQSLSPIQASLRRLGRDRRAMASLGLLLFFVLASYVGPVFYTHIGPTLTHQGLIANETWGPDTYHSYVHQDLNDADGYSQGYIHPFGTDQIGRDTLARLLAGINVSIQVALIAEAFDVGLGLLIGTLAGFFGGFIDQFLARFTDVIFAFPGLLFVILAAAALGPAFTTRLGPIGRLVLVGVAIGVTAWPQMARFVRGQTLQLKQQQFVEAARTVGGTNSTIIMRHIVPNLISIVVVAASLDVLGVILGEAALSYLGLGVQAPGSSLGLMISDASSVLPINPTEVYYPTLVLAAIVLALSFVGDGARDAFDPRTKD